MPAVAERLSNETGKKKNRSTIHAAMMQQQQQM